MAIYDEEAAMKYLGITASTSTDIDLRNAPPPVPDCSCARTMMIDGEVYEVRAGGGSRNAGCRVHNDGWENKEMPMKMGTMVDARRIAYSAHKGKSS